MACGMSVDEFYNGDPFLVNIYAAKYREQKRENNYNAWVQGMYTLKALEVVLGGMFSKGGQKPVYPAEPFPFYETETEKAERVERENENMALTLERLANGYKNQLKTNNDIEGGNE